MNGDDKIVFLDVDGVLNSDDFYARWMLEEGVDCFETDTLDPHALALLKKLVRETDAKVIISSSWRWDNQAMGNLTSQLRTYGIFAIGTTIDDIRVNLSRAGEIKLWLDSHPEIVNYVILDDARIDIDELARHHIKTNSVYGLQLNHIEQAKNILNGDLING